jgi:hypothetical protein
MKAETVIKTRLSSFAGVTALVGVAPNDRVYPSVIPQDPTFPLIMFKRSSSRRLTGAHTDPGICYATVQVVCLAKTADDVLALAEQVRLALERFGYAITGTLIGSVLVYDITVGSDAVDYDGELDIHIATADYTVLHAE